MADPLPYPALMILKLHCLRSLLCPFAFLIRTLHFGIAIAHRPSLSTTFPRLLLFIFCSRLFTNVHAISGGEGASCHSLNSQLRDSSLITLTNTVKTQRKHTEKHIQTPMKHTKTQKNTLEKNRARAGPRLATPADPFNPTPREAPNDFAFGSHPALSTQHSALSTNRSSLIIGIPG